MEETRKRLRALLIAATESQSTIKTGFGLYFLNRNTTITGQIFFSACSPFQEPLILSFLIRTLTPPISPHPTYFLNLVLPHNLAKDIIFTQTPSDPFQDL